MRKCVEMSAFSYMECRDKIQERKVFFGYKWMASVALQCIIMYLCRLIIQLENRWASVYTLKKHWLMLHFFYTLHLVCSFCMTSAVIKDYNISCMICMCFIVGTIAKNGMCRPYDEEPSWTTGYDWCRQVDRCRITSICTHSKQKTHENESLCCKYFFFFVTVPKML